MREHKRARCAFNCPGRDFIRRRCAILLQRTPRSTIYVRVLTLRAAICNNYPLARFRVLRNGNQKRYNNVTTINKARNNGSNFRVFSIKLCLHRGTTTAVLVERVKTSTCTLQSCLSLSVSLRFSQETPDAVHRAQKRVGQLKPLRESPSRANRAERAKRAAVPFQ